MKKKAFILLNCSLLVILLYGGTGCTLHKQLNSQKTKQVLEEEQNILSKSTAHFGLRDSRITWQRDSSGHTYRVSILPADTFSYSPEHGFKGRAKSVEIEGYHRTARIILDSSSRSLNAAETRKTDIRKSRLQKQEKQSRIKDKKSRPGMIALGGFVLAVIILGYFVKRKLDS